MDLPVLLLAPPEDAEAERLAALLRVPLVHRGKLVLGRRLTLLHVRAHAHALPRAILAGKLAGARAITWTPLGEPPPALPWAARFAHRLLHASQEDARAWRACGIALGRQVVLPETDPEPLAASLRAIWRESLTMAGALPLPRAAREGPAG
jgi:hypothetical protein